MINLGKLGEFLGGLISALPIIKEWRQAIAGRRDHDRRKFDEMDALLPERLVDEYLAEVESRVLTSATAEAVWEYLEWARFYENAFTIRKLQNAREEMDRALHDLNEFTKNNYFSEPTGRAFIFQPGLKARPQEYADLLENQLIPRVLAVKQAYIAFRRFVKRHLTT